MCHVQPNVITDDISSKTTLRKFSNHILGLIKHQIRFEKFWKFIFITIYMVSIQHIRSIGRRIALRIRHPTEDYECSRGLHSYGVGLRITDTEL